VSGHLSSRLFAEACRIIPGGVNSPVRAWKAVGGEPLFIQRAHGCWVVDADGREYVDYVGSWGPMILGHAHGPVLRAVQEALRDGTSFGAPTAREIELARLIVDAFPSIEMVRLMSSGTEAAMTALRLARGFTGRSRIVKFAGCYHGHSDALLVRAGSGAMTFGVPDSPGVPPAVAGETLIARYNDLESVEACADAAGDELAAVVVEPIAGNMGLVPPAPGFLHGLRELTRRRGALLVFDEVITGFRVAYGGVQTIEGIEPDLTCLGKIIGGGLPVGAVGGRREVMEKLAPVGPVYQAGTLSGNPLSVAAGVAMLQALRQPRVYPRLEELGARLELGLRSALERAGVRAHLARVGSMFTLFFGIDHAANADDVGGCDTERFGRYFRGMIERGIYLPPSQFEVGFVGLSHSEAEIDATVEAASGVFVNL
jgi:glutamate-1-semialdehyde 2,1-aminomutase